MRHRLPETQGKEKGREADMEMQRVSAHWFQLTGDPWVEVVDKWSGGNVHPDRVMNQWVLVLMLRGQRTFRVYGEGYAVRAGDFFLLPPYVRHCGIEYDEHEAYFAHFRAEGVHAALPEKLDTERILLPLCGQVPLELPCFSLMEYMVSHRSAPFFSEHFLTSQVQAILYQLSLTAQKKFLWSKPERSFAYQILQFIDGNKSRQLHKRDYAEAFGRSYDGLNNLTQSVYGVTIKQMQVILRVEQAKRMLSSGRSIAETSEACGFNDYFYFLKVFKKKTGMTPSEYQSS